MAQERSVSDGSLSAVGGSPRSAAGGRWGRGVRRRCCGGAAAVLPAKESRSTFCRRLLGRNGSISEPWCCLGYWEDPRLQNKWNLQPVDISVVAEVDLHRMEDSVEPPGLRFTLFFTE